MAKKKIVLTTVNKKTGEVVKPEDGGLFFHPANQHLDLTVAEKRRTTALMMAIQAHEQMIIRDAEYYRAVKDDERRGGGPAIRPATFDSIVEGAIRFDWFISGDAQRWKEAHGSLDAEPPIQVEESTDARR